MGWLTQPDIVLTESQKFEIAVKRLADSLNYGSDTSPFLGSGIDFAQSRPYIPGDPVKSIDWRVTARTGRVHVKEYEAPKRMPVWILLDTSASMCISSVKHSKYAVGLQIATAVGLAAQQRLSPVGLLGVGEREIRLQPTLAKGRLMETAQRLRQYRVDEATRLSEKIRQWSPAIENRSMIMILSDFHDEDALDAVKRLACEHDCIAVHLSDPIESGMDGHAVFRVREAETGAVYSAVSCADWFDSGELRRTLAQVQADYLPLNIARPIIPPLRHFLAKRGILGRAVR